MPYSKSEPSIFKSGQLMPVKDLKLLVKDYTVCLFEFLGFLYHSMNIILIHVVGIADCATCFDDFD